MSDKVVFEGYDPMLKQSRADKGFKVEFETSQDQYPKIMGLPLLEGRVLKITVEEAEK